MAVTPASAVAELAVAELRSAMGDQVTMLFSFKDDLEGMKETLESIVAVLTDAESRSVRESSVRLWLKRLKDAAYDICDMLDEFQDGTKAGLLSSFTIVPKFTLAHKMKKMREQLRKIDEDHKKFGFSPDSSANNEQQFTASQETRSTTSKFNQEDIVGREKEKKEIVALLSESSTKEEAVILPIHGLGGIGKTTLARLVFNDYQFKEYDHRVWVYVSQVFDLKKIGCSIISQISNKESESLNDRELMNKRLDELIHGKNILIILDDLWEERNAELEKLKTMLNIGKSGSKIDVIVTTRKVQIARKFWTGKSYNLKPLVDTECWDIIKKRCDLESKPEKEQLKQLGLDIAKKCGGVALAAQALGYMLSEMNLKEWLAVRDSYIWNDPCHDDKNSPENSVLPSLMLSYEHMASELRLCFAYCAIFPKGQNIAKDDLIHQWIALDFIKPSNIFPASQLGEKYIRQLLGMSFLQHSKLPSTSQQQAVFTMHDLVHDLARSVMDDELLVFDSNKGSNSCEQKYCRYALLTNYSGPTKLSAICPAKVRALLFLDCSELGLRNDAFLFAKCLRVLDLSGCPLSKLPECVTRLSRLQYLNLHGSREISALPESIGKVERLIHLDLSNCRMLVELPESLGNLKSLIHLELSDCSRVVAMPKSFCGLTKLQYLNLSNCSNLEKLPEAIGSLTELQYLKLSGCCKIGILPESFWKLHNLVRLDLSSCRMLVELPESLGNLKSLLHLELSDCSRVVAMPKSFCGLTKLQYLNLSNCSNLEKLPEAIGSLTELQHLNLSGCCKIGVLPESFGKLHNLVHLDLSSPRVEGVSYAEEHLRGLSDVLGNLTELQYLNLSESLNPIYYHLPSSEREGYVQCISALTNLEHLDISGNILHYLPESLGNLKRLHTLDVSGSHLHSLPESIGAIHTLKFLRMANCLPALTEHIKHYQFKNSFSLPIFTVHANDANTCSNLHQLGDINCDELEICCLENIISMEEARAVQLLEKQNLSKLTFDWTSGPDRLYLDDKDVLGELVPPKDLKELVLRGYNGVCFPTWLMGISQHLPNLVKIKLENLPRCNHLPPLGQLPNLEELHLKRLHNITKLDGDFCGGRGAFRRLSTFWLEEMERLEEWSTTYSGEDGVEEFMFPKLETLQTLYCRSLRLKPCPPIFSTWYIRSSDKVISPWREGGHISVPSSTPATTLEVSHSNVPKWRLLHHIPTLQELKLNHCDYLASLPDSMRHLTSLRSLELSFCHNISVLPEWMGDLTSLESLEIIECQRLKSLPQCVQQLTMLKKLYIRLNYELKKWCESDENKIKLAHIKDISYEDCDSMGDSLSENDSVSLQLFMSSDVNTCGNLHQLEDVNLNALQISCLEDVRFLEEARKIKLLDRQNVSKLTLEWTSDDDRILEDKDVLGELVPPEGVQHLKLGGYSSISFPTWLMGIYQYLPNLVEIVLENMPRCNNLPPLGQLPNLKELHLRRLHSITKIDGDFCGGKGAFLRLSRFSLDHMEQLEAWNTTYGGEDGVEEFMFPMLDELHIKDCPKLRLIPCPPIFRSWTIQKSDEVVSSWSEGDHVSHSPSDTPGTRLMVWSSKVPMGEWRLLHHLPTLQELEIYDCDKLTSLPENMQYLASLQSLELSWCRGISALPEWLGHLTSLKILKIDACGSIKSLPQCIQQLTKLTKLKIVESLRLKIWCESEDNKMNLAHIKHIELGHEYSSESETDENGDGAEDKMIEEDEDADEGEDSVKAQSSSKRKRSGDDDDDDGDDGGGDDGRPSKQ